MTIIQVEQTPIGDHFHDSGVNQMFNELANSVDDFEVESTQLITYIDCIVRELNGLKSLIKKCEKESAKHEVQQALEDKIHRGCE